MGLTKAQAEGALRKCDNILERAIDYIFNHPDEKYDSSSDQSIVKVDTADINRYNSAVFDLYGFITHLGRNTSHGHYVAHLRKENGWIYFNDSRVTSIDNPPVHKGYIYFYKNKTE